MAERTELNSQQAALLQIVNGKDRSELNSDLVNFLLEASSEFIIEHDPSGKILRGSPSASRALGYKPGEFVQLGLAEVAMGDYRESLASCFAKSDASDLHTLEGTLCRRDGSKIYVRGLARTIGEGSDAELIASVKPVERRNQPYQITQAQKLEAIGQLAAGIAHEINTPTQYVGDNVRFLQDCFAGLNSVLSELLSLADAAEAAGFELRRVSAIRALVDEVDLEYLTAEIPKATSQTLEGVEQIARIVRAMKEFSHPDRDEKTLVQINSAIENTITVSKNEWKYVAEIEKNLDPTLPMVPCLAGEFNQVLLNILVNAAHAIAEKNGDSGERGKITIASGRVDDWAEVRFSDTGAGIPEHARARIFDPFFTTKEVGKGTGQGLALAYSIVVEKHGGSISFETEPGVGTTFIIRIPINATRAEAA